MKRDGRPPLSAAWNNACFIVKDANGVALSYVHFENEPGRRTAANLMTKDEARKCRLRTVQSCICLIRLAGRFHRHSDTWLPPSLISALSFCPPVLHSATFGAGAWQPGLGF
jgi:hypothetical protein